MTEREKAKLGLLYDADHPELVAERTACKDLCHRYNMLAPSDQEGRAGLLREILGDAGQGLRIEQPFWCDYGAHIHVGEGFYANHNCTILDGAEVVFGDQVYVGPDCGFYTAGHPLDAQQRVRGLEYALPIHVGNRVWIGGHVTVLPGVTIGDESVIGAGSVVTHDIPPGVVAAGAPCRVIRPITPKDRNQYREALE